MFTSDVLLYPDTGPRTIAAMKTAALYAERVHTLTILESDLTAAFMNMFSDQEPRRNDPGFGRLRSYFEFIDKNAGDLTLLQEQGVLHAVDMAGIDTLDQVWGRARQQLSTYSDRRIREGVSLDEPYYPESIRSLLDSAYEEATGTFSDLSSFLAPFEIGKSGLSVKWDLVDLIDEIRGEDVSSDLDVLTSLTFPIYLLMVSVVAEENGIVPLATSAAAQRALFAMRSLAFSNYLTDGVPLRSRNLVSSKVERAVLETYLPAVHRLSMDAILSLRAERSPELEALRDASRRLAADIDLSDGDPDQLDLRVHDRVVRDVGDALTDLQRALRSSRIENIKNALGSASGLASGVVPATLAVAAGAPLPVGLIAGVFGSAANAVSSLFLDQKRIKGASNWGFIVDLQREVSRIDERH